MSTAYVVVTIVAAVMVAYSAAAIFFRAGWVVRSLTEYHVPRSWWPWLAAAKAAGAVGLLVGLFVPNVGLAAKIALIASFVGAVITVIRARWYAHIPYPMLYMAPVVGALVLGFVA